jgi:hypothetical protein
MKAICDCPTYVYASMGAMTSTSHQLTSVIEGKVCQKRRRLYMCKFVSRLFAFEPPSDSYEDGLQNPSIFFLSIRATEIAQTELGSRTAKHDHGTSGTSIIISYLEGVFAYQSTIMIYDSLLGPFPSTSPKIHTNSSIHISIPGSEPTTG